jgi:hypothetical protein
MTSVHLATAEAIQHIRAAAGVAEGTGEKEWVAGVEAFLHLAPLEAR